MVGGPVTDLVFGNVAESGRYVVPDEGGDVQWRVRGDGGLKWVQSEDLGEVEAGEVHWSLEFQVNMFGRDCKVRD